MRKRFLLVGFLMAAACTFVGTRTATAGPVPYDSSFTIPAGQTCVTNPVALAAGSFDIDRVVFFNTGAVTASVVVDAYDVGVYTPIATFSISALAGSCQWPRRSEVAHTTTNNYLYVARDLRLIGTKQTNATDVVIFYRVLFSGN